MLVLLWLFGWLVTPGQAQQPMGGPFQISRSTLDNGGGQSDGGVFSIRGTIAQPDSSPLSSTGGSFALTGGFWARGPLVPPGNNLFSDGFESN